MNRLPKCSSLINLSNKSHLFPSMLMQAYVSATGAAVVVALGLIAMVKVSFGKFVLQL